MVGRWVDDCFIVELSRGFGVVDVLLQLRETANCQVSSDKATEKSVSKRYKDAGTMQGTIQ